MRVLVMSAMLGACAIASGQTLPTTVPVEMPATLPATLPTTSPTTQASTQPTTRPIGRSSREILPPDYAVFTTRSIFMKGRVPTPVNITTDIFGPSTGTTQPRKSEDMIVFNGVTDVDGDVAAFIEDTSTGKVSTYKTGDSIAQGKILNITLDSLEYQGADGRSVRVLIGQTLTGGEAVPLSERAAPPGSSSPGDPNSVLEKMKRKAGR